MERFLARRQGRIVGTISGFDRVLFRGTLRSISYVRGLEILLSSQQVLHKEFGEYARKLSEQVIANAKAIADKHTVHTSTFILPRFPRRIPPTRL